MLILPTACQKNRPTIPSVIAATVDARKAPEPPIGTVRNIPSAAETPHEEERPRTNSEVTASNARCDVLRRSLLPGSASRRRPIAESQGITHAPGSIRRSKIAAKNGQDCLHVSEKEVQPFEPPQIGVVLVWYRSQTCRAQSVRTWNGSHAASKKVRQSSARPVLHSISQLIARAFQSTGSIL